jgi:hypothetical protein
VQSRALVSNGGDEALDVFQITGRMDGAGELRGWFGHDLFECGHRLIEGPHRIVGRCRDWRWRRHCWRFAI